MSLRKIRRRIQTDESGAALLGVVLVLIVLMGILTAVTAMTLTSIQKSAATRDFTMYSIATDTAISDALSKANNHEAVNNGAGGVDDYFAGKGLIDTDDPTGETPLQNAEYGEVSSVKNNLGIKWRWFAEPSSDTTTQRSYDIYASAYRGDNPADDPRARHIRAKVQAVAVDAGRYDSETQRIIYALSPTTQMTKGVIGFTDILWSDPGASIQSYNSGMGTAPTLGTGASAAVTNGTLEFNYKPSLLAGMPADIGGMYSVTPDAPSNDRCVSADNGACPIPVASSAFGIETTDVAEEIKTACEPTPADGEDPIEEGKELDWMTNWVASANGATLTANKGDNVLCVKNLTFDVNTIVHSKYNTSYSPDGLSDDALHVYVTGDITVDSGVTVQGATAAAVHGPLSLRIVSSGAKVDVEGVLSGVPTSFSGLISAPYATCNIAEGGTTQQAVYYGTIACDHLVLNGKSTLWYDSMIEEVPFASGQVFIWEVAEYDNRTSDPAESIIADLNS